MKFSIIVPVYNAEKFLRPCLDSVLNQTESDWECVCVDDGSADASGDILDDYGKRDSRFRLIHLKNGGVARARNVGLDAAKGEWITWIDADDLYAPDRLSEAKRLIDCEQPDLVRFRTYFGKEDESGIPAARSENRGYAVCDGIRAQKWGWQVLAPGGMVWTWAARRSLLEGVRFPPGMRIKEDSIFCARLANRLKRVVQSEYAAYFYRQVPSSAMYSVRCADDCIRLLTAVGELYSSEACATPNLDADVRRVMMRWLRAHCESDIIDWIRMRRGERDRNCEIHARYHELRKLGVFEAESALGKIYRLPFWWWKVSHATWMLSLAVRIHHQIAVLRHRET